MKYRIRKVIEFARPYYADKDIMHDFSHIERIKVSLSRLSQQSDLKYDREIAEVALHFHGFIYSHEKEIRTFLSELEMSTEDIEWVIKIAWESQKEHKPTTNEGLMLHDAHMLEGGRSFEIIKSLITGSVRGQSLEETMTYIENNLLSKGECYTEAGKEQYQLMKQRTLELYEELKVGTGRG